MSVYDPHFPQVKPVRDAILHALHTYEALEEFMQSEDSTDWADFWCQAKSFTPPLSSGKLMPMVEQTAETCEKSPSPFHESNTETPMQQLSQHLTRQRNDEEGRSTQRKLTQSREISEVRVENQDENERKNSLLGTRKSEDSVNAWQGESCKNLCCANTRRGHDVLSEESVYCEQGDIKLQTMHLCNV